MFPICSNKFSIFSPDFPYIFIHRSPTPISGYRPSVAEFQVDVGDHSTQDQLIFYGDLGTKKTNMAGKSPYKQGEKHVFFIWENHRKTMGTQIKWRLYSWEIPSINGGFSIATGMITKEVYGLSTSRFRYAKMRSLVNLD